MHHYLILVTLIFLATSVSAQEPISPLEKISGLNSNKVSLGRSLFRDVRFSRDNTKSCFSCHDLKKNGSDSLPVGIGINGQAGVIKTPTVYNSGFNFVQFWDGRSRTLENQVSGPIHNPVELGSNWAEVIRKLNSDPAILSRFNELYVDGITAANIADAIADFERSLVTTGSRFDKWLAGNKNALTKTEIEGYRLFKGYGCISCHQGKNVGGNMYARMGNIRDYFSERGKPITQADLGRFNVTGLDWDKHLFKVPSLRLASLQKYFFHDSSVSSLQDAIKVMARYQLGREIGTYEAGLIEEFIESLAGTHHEMEAE
ncbi:cytochrome-c peroxidase [Neptuniibacter sp.]|uniref:cytochrome-c peroxidase n=1 Tax=Neptuniibacter sp. TaxID=1962643 RepID=UPI003B596459